MLGDVEVAIATAVFLPKVRDTQHQAKLTTTEIGIVVSALVLVAIVVTVGGMIILRGNRRQSFTSG